MALDLHKKPFDEGTIVKLSLYKNYIKEWLPVFLRSNSQFRCINIFDFFCGPGEDDQGQKGSPLITLEILDQYIEHIKKYDITVSLFFNDKRKKKVLKLKEHISQLYPDEPPFKFSFSYKDFDSFFKKSIHLMEDRDSANFLFLDQNGIKHITEEIFQIIVNIETTDFLFFISSSTLCRFNDNPDIKKYICIPKEILSASEYCHIHRCVLEYYRSLIPENREYYLSPFSIKKGANIYGLIFGTGHLLGIDKFVNQCWKIDPHTGDSNFDIDNDNIDEDQMSLFPEIDRPKKIQGFEKELKDAILCKKLNTNTEIYKYTLFNGFKAEQARKVVAKLIQDGHIPRQRLNLSYGSCKLGKQPQQINFGSTK
jgi:three-Cys-motif partner protein